MWHRVRRARGQLGRRGACALAAPMARQRGAMTRHVRAAARGTPDPHAATGRGWGSKPLCHTARRRLWHAVHEAREGPPEATSRWCERAGRRLSTPRLALGGAR